MGNTVRRAMTIKIINVSIVSEREQNKHPVTLECYGTCAQCRMSLDASETLIIKAIEERGVSLV